MGKRGEGWVAVQLLLMVLIVLWPRGSGELWPRWVQTIGGLLLLGGGAVSGAAVLNLGRNLTPLPAPVEDGQLVEHGIYGWVRHPIYFGLILAAIGWSLLRSNPFALLLSLLLLPFFDAKARREEQWLAERYPAYAAYQQRVKRLIPWLY